MSRTRTVAIGAAAVAGAVAAYAVGIRAMNRWGATPAEVVRTYPGDELVAPPTTATAMAVAVDAEPEDVWRWLVQIGQDRGGFYSYDWLENLFGLGIHSATEVREEWQHLVPGDEIRLVPPGWAGIAEGYGFRVARVERPHLLVLRQAPPEHPWDGVWTFAIEPREGGGCRLISHACTHRAPGIGGRVLAAGTSIAGTPVTWLMTQRMLRTLAERAEGVERAERAEGVERVEGVERRTG